MRVVQRLRRRARQRSEQVISKSNFLDAFQPPWLPDRRMGIERPPERAGSRRDETALAVLADLATAHAPDGLLHGLDMLVRNECHDHAANHALPRFQWLNPCQPKDSANCWLIPGIIVIGRVRRIDGDLSGDQVHQHP